METQLGKVVVRKEAKDKVTGGAKYDFISCTLCQIINKCICSCSEARILAEKMRISVSDQFYQGNLINR